MCVHPIPSWPYLDRQVQEKNEFGDVKSAVKCVLSPASPYSSWGTI